MTTGAVDDVGLHARLRSSALAAVDLARDRAWTYGALDHAVGQCAAALAARGVGLEDRVACLAKNRVSLVTLHLACARLGAIFVPLNWRLAPAEVQWLVKDAEPKLVLGDQCLADAELAGVSLDDFEDEIARAAPRPLAPIDPDRPSLILYTSGTSGRPKGVLVSERNLTETAINLSLLGQVTAASRFLCDAPMFHVIGLVANIRPALMQGGAFLVSDGFVPARTLERLGDPALGVTHYFCVPQMAAALRAEPAFDPDKLKGLTAIFTGGAPHPAANIRAWLDDGIVVANGFGMSEAGTVFGMPLDRELIAEHAGAAGVATPRVQARIVDGEGRDLPTGEPGELQLKGANVARGYWRRPEETAAAFTADGWFRTGDVARVDDQGFYWIVDRTKDMFISGGENVYPAEIEAALAGLPELAECAVVGVPDPRWGEVGHLYLVAASGAAIDPDALLAGLDGRIARYKIPKRVSVIEALPRNGAGKVLKAELRALAKEQAS